MFIAIKYLQICQSRLCIKFIQVAEGPIEVEKKALLRSRERTAPE
jgi:hypothetical protein